MAQTITGPTPRFEVASGTIDGSNRLFGTSVPYLAGTTAVYLNGQLLRIDYANGWEETDPATGQFTMNEAPIPGDVVQVFFIDTSTSPLDITVVAPLHGRVLEVLELQGRMVEVDARVCRVKDLMLVLGSVQESDSIRGTVTDTDSLLGRMAEVIEQ